MRVTLAVLCVLGSLGLPNAALATLEPPSTGVRVSSARVSSALVRWGWREIEAQRVSNVVPVFVTDLSYLRVQGFYVNALLIEQCPAAGSAIYLDPSVADDDNYIWHEFQHWVEWTLGNCSYDNAALLRDMRVLTQHQDLVDSYDTLVARGRSDALSHFNHSLAARIDYKFYTLPATYRAKYFWYASAQAPTPTPRPTVTPVLASRFKVLVPLALGMKGV